MAGGRLKIAISILLISRQSKTKKNAFTVPTKVDVNTEGRNKKKKTVYE
jgi:hypothetical protein